MSSNPKNNLVLGYPNNLSKYLDKECNFRLGTIGRVANRLEDASFELNGKCYHVAQNHRDKHCIHSGEDGCWDRVFWEVESVSVDRVVFRYEEGDEEFPGQVVVRAVYALKDNVLDLEYHVENVDCVDTITNVTNHVYWNLNGSGDIWNHELQIFSDEVTDTDQYNMNNGKIRKVDQSLDFQKQKVVGKDAQSVLDSFTKGYDHNYVLQNDGKVSLAAILSGQSVSMKVFTNAPGLQFYTGNFIKCKGHFLPHEGLCLEAQSYPNSMKHKHFPSIVLPAGEKMIRKIRYVFEEKK